MSFRHPCDLSDDVILGHARIGIYDMLSVFLCIRFILSRCLRLKPERDPKWSNYSIWLSKHSPWCSAATQCNTHIKRVSQSLVAACLLLCQQRLPAFSNGNHSSFCRSCTCLVSFYRICGYIPGVWRPRQLLEDLIETVKGQNRFNHIILFDIRVHLMI